MADRILLFLNGLYWKSISSDELIIARLDTPPMRRDVSEARPLPAYFPEHQGGDVLIPIAQRDERVLEHWLPGVGVLLASNRIVATQPRPFGLKAATGTPDAPEYFMEFHHCLLDTQSEEWARFAERITRYDELTPTWLRFSFADFWRADGCNRCEDAHAA